MGRGKEYEGNSLESFELVIYTSVLSLLDRIVTVREFA